ncbi:MAG: rod shape-determining protein MreC [Phycisphaeraceae bacterium]
MPKRVLTPRRRLLLVAALLLVASLLPTRVATTLAAPARELLAATVLPVAVPLKTLARALRRPETPELALDDETHPGRGLQYRRQLEQEVDRLRQENQALRQVRAIVGDRPGLEAVSARVGGVSGGAGLNPTLTIDRGSQRGVARDQVVVWGFSLVGRVTRAGPLTADVGLITATDTAVSARIVPPTMDAPQRQWRGWLAYDPETQALTAEIGPDEQVEAGDLAHLDDTAWPAEAQGFVIGRVASVERDPDEPYLIRRVIVRPFLPLTSLSQVSVLVGEAD